MITTGQTAHHGEDEQRSLSSEAEIITLCELLICRVASVLLSSANRAAKLARTTLDRVAVDRGTLGDLKANHSQGFSPT